MLRGIWVALVWAMLLGVCQAQSSNEPGLVTEHGTYAIRLLGRRIGTEDYTVKQQAGGTTVLQATLQQTDRGAAMQTNVTLAMDRSWRPLRFVQKTAPALAEAERVLIGEDLAGYANGTGATRSGKAGGVALLGALPASVQMMALRCWMARGRPLKLPVLHANGDAPALEVREVGHEAIYLPRAEGKGRIVRLTRYTVKNLAFGREVVWMNENGRLAALMTFAGGLPQEAVLDEYESVTGDLVHSGVRQELLDLAVLGREVKPVVQGSYAISGVRLVDGTGAPPLEGATVVVRDGKVASVGTDAPPAGLRVVRADGETLLPGLWAMQEHFSGVEFGPALLARGVTTVRDCGGELEFLVSVRRAIEHDRLPGPRLLLAGLISGGGAMAFGAVEAETARQGEDAVSLYAEQGFEQVRPYGAMKPEVLAAIRAAAQARGLGVSEDVLPCSEGGNETMEAWVRAGMTPAAALQAVTSGAAHAMKLQGSVGTVQAGMRADLVLVRGNPLADIGAMRSVTRVVKGGVMWDAGALRRSVGLAP